MRAWLEKNGYRLVALLIEIVSALAAIGFAGPARILFLAVALLSALAGVVLFWTAEQDPSELLTLTPRPPLHKHTRSARCIVVIAFVLGVLLLVFVATPSIKSAVTGPEPTPLAGKPAAEDEILVVVAEFEKSSGAEYEPHIDMLEVLEQAAEEVGNVRVIALNQTIQDREEAQRISDVYNATMVVYGRVAPGGVTARYEISPRFNKFCCVESQEFRVSSAEIENFEAFLYEGMDLNYILGLTLGQLYYYDKQYEKAIDAFSRAADSLADERREQLKANILFIYRGDAYVEQGLFDQAIKDYGKALEVDSRDANAYNNRGTAYANQGEYQKSIEDFERAIQFAPNDPVSYFNLGVTFVKLGENDKALSLFSQTIRVDPLFYKAYFNRGVLLDTVKGNCISAIDDYTQVIHLKPLFSGAYNNRGVCYVQLGEFDEAIEDYSQAIRLNPLDPMAYSNRGHAYLKLGYLDASISDLSEAIRFDPSNSQVYYDRGTALFYKGEYESAISDYTLAIDYDPQFAKAYYGRGLIFIRQGLYNEAIGDYTQAIKLNPEFAEAFRDRGLAYFELGFYSKAIQDYDKAIQIEPKFVEAYSNRGKAYFNIGAYEESIADYTTAIELRPFTPELFYLRSLAYAGAHKYDLAIADLEQYANMTGDTGLQDMITDFLEEQNRSK